MDKDTKIEIIKVFHPLQDYSDLWRRSKRNKRRKYKVALTVFSKLISFAIRRKWGILELDNFESMYMSVGYVNHYIFNLEGK